MSRGERDASFTSCRRSVTEEQVPFMFLWRICTNAQALARSVIVQWYMLASGLRMSDESSGLYLEYVSRWDNMSNVDEWTA